MLVVAFLIADVDVAWPAIVEVLLVDYYLMDRALPVFRLVNSDVLANLIIIVGGGLIIVVGFARSNSQTRGCIAADVLYLTNGE